MCGMADEMKKRERRNPVAPNMIEETMAIIGAPQQDVIEKLVYQDNPNAIQRHDDGTMTYKRFTLTPIGLHVPEDVEPDELRDVARVIRDLQTSIQWIVGDLLNSMERVWGKSYQTVAEQLGYEVKTVQEWASICKNVSIRMEGLSFGHHQLVSSYSPEDQHWWLQWAMANKASIATLRKAIYEWRNPPKQLALKLKFSDEVIESEHDTYTHLTRVRNAIKGGQVLSAADVLKDAIALKKFAEQVIRDMGGES